jgi:acetoacetyl-CoA synthetase
MECGTEEVRGQMSSNSGDQGAGTANVSDGEVLWRPSVASLRRARLTAYAAWLEERGVPRFEDYTALWRWSVDDIGRFWRTVLDYSEISYDGDPATALVAAGMPGTRWFPEVRLNFAEHALAGSDDDLAFIAYSQTRVDSRMSIGELRDVVARAAAGLRRLGVRPGDRVAGYLPNIPEALIGLLASASIGAIWAVCAPELGSRSVLDRLQQIQPQVLIAVDGYRYGDKEVNREEDLASISASLPSLEHTVLVPYLRGDRDVPRPELAWSDLVADDAEPSYTRVAFDAPLWILFSSGTTGLPKAIVHSHGGIALEQWKTLALHSDMGPGDRHFVYCTTSWMMWNVQVATLLARATCVLFDGNPNYPGPDELWRIMATAEVTHFACGAAFFTGCRQQRQVPKDHFDLSRLRAVTSTASPLPADSFRWIYECVNPDLYLQSASGGTDVCGAFVGGSPWLAVRAGEIAGRMLGVDAVAFDESGREVAAQLGELVIKQAMPSMPVFFWNDPDGQRYRDAYFEKFPGRWCHGDWVKFLESGGCVITGRSDGTLNRGGVRLGTSEFYAALSDVDAVADSLVVHLEDSGGGTGELILFVQLAEGRQLDHQTESALRDALRAALSPRHVPDFIIAVPAIPYNLTGKKLEVPVKKLLRGSPRQDVISEGSVRDPSSLDAFEATTLRRNRGW